MLARVAIKSCLGHKHGIHGLRVVMVGEKRAMELATSLMVMRLLLLLRICTILRLLLFVQSLRMNA